MSIEFKDVHASLSKAQILKGVSLIAEDGLITGIVGPNGCGKSTLIKTLFSIVPMSSGEILLDGQNVKNIRARAIAEKVGYVGQESNSLFNFKVREVVKMGLYPHKHAGMTRAETDAVVEKAICDMKLESFTDRGILSLSGGEKKMVYLARTIAQEVGTIVLDEPTNHLDICHQLHILNFLKNSGKTVLIVLHDLSLAARYCDRIFVMKNGTVIGNGSPINVLTDEMVWNVFEVHGKCSVDDNGICRFCLY